MKIDLNGTANKISSYHTIAIPREQGKIQQGTKSAMRTFMSL